MPKESTSRTELSAIGTFACDFFDDQSQLFSHLGFDRPERVRVVPQELLDVFAALAEGSPLYANHVPLFSTNLSIGGEIEQIIFPRNPFALQCRIALVAQKER